MTLGTGETYQLLRNIIFLLQLTLHSRFNIF